MNQTAILDRATLMRLFATAVEDKVKAIDNPNLSVKTKKRLSADLIAKINGSLHSDDKPILLPNEFEIQYHHWNMLGGFTWERGDYPHTETGGFSFICGTNTQINKRVMGWIRDPDNLAILATPATLVKYLKEKPSYKQELSYVKPTAPNQPKFSADNCPICLEGWCETTKKRRGMCGHLVCHSCINMVIVSANPCCPVCRANYKTNGTFRQCWKQTTQEEWEHLHLGQIATYLEENNGYTNRPALKRLCNLTKFQNEYLITHSHKDILEMWIGDIDRYNLDNGIQTYFIKGLMAYL